MLNHSNKISSGNDKHSKELTAVPGYLMKTYKIVFQNDLYIYVVIVITEQKNTLHFFGKYIPKSSHFHSVLILYSEY
jgi:hypothetical protein